MTLAHKKKKKSLEAEEYILNPFDEKNFYEVFTPNDIHGKRARVAAVK